MSERPIEMRYNFPLLPGTAVLWKLRLAMAVAALPETEDDALRPTFRQDESRLRTAAAHWIGSEPAQTWLTCGGHHGTLVAMLAARVAGKRIAFDHVTYTGGLEQARMLGCATVPVETDDEGMRADALRAACERAAAAGEPVAAVYVMPNVQNPLGCSALLERREALAAVAREHDLIVIEDDAYGFMEERALPTMCELAPERTFSVRGLSKSFAPAARIGFLVAPERFSAAVASALKNSTTGVSAVHASAAVGLIEDGTLDCLMAEKRAEGARRNAAARAVLGEAAAPGARCAWHLWLRLPCGPEAFEERLRARGVLVSGGNWFAADGSSPRAVRLALGGEVDAERTQRGCELVAQALYSFEV